MSRKAYRHQGRRHGSVVTVDGFTHWQAGDAGSQGVTHQRPVPMPAAGQEWPGISRSGEPMSQCPGAGEAAMPGGGDHSEGGSRAESQK
jgi:hypothetical protein